MAVFDNYKRIIDLSEFAVPVSGNVAEMQEIYRVESIEMQVLWDTMVEIFREQFIMTAESHGLTQWETILDIIPEVDDTIDDRRFNILLALAGQRPYTEIKLRELLNSICGKGNYQIVEDYKNYNVHFKVALGAKRQRNAVNNLLKDLIPMNLIYQVDLLYNRHIDLSRYTHKELANFTHFALNQEVLPK